VVKKAFYSRKLLPVLVELERKVDFISRKFLFRVRFEDYIHWKYSRGRATLFYDDTDALGVLIQDRKGEYKGQSWGADAVSIFAYQPKGRWSFARILISYTRKVRASGKRNWVVCEPELDKTMAKAGYKIVGVVYLLSRGREKTKRISVLPVSSSDYLLTANWTSRLFAPSYYEDRLVNCPIAQYYNYVQIRLGDEEIGKMVYRVDEESDRIVILDWICRSDRLLPLLVSSTVNYEDKEFADLIYGCSGKNVPTQLKFNFNIEGMRYLRAYPDGKISGCLTALDLDLEELLW